MQRASEVGRASYFPLFGGSVSGSWHPLRGSVSSASNPGSYAGVSLLCHREQKIQLDSLDSSNLLKERLQNKAFPLHAEAENYFQLTIGKSWTQVVTQLHLTVDGMCHWICKLAEAASADQISLWCGWVPWSPNTCLFGCSVTSDNGASARHKNHAKWFTFLLAVPNAFRWMVWWGPSWTNIRRCTWDCGIHPTPARFSALRGLETLMQIGCVRLEPFTPSSTRGH